MKLALLIITLTSFLWSHQLQADCSLKVSWEPWKPLLFEDNGIATGLDNDLTRLIVENSGCKLTFHQRPWARSLKEIAHGIIDFTAAASLTEEREKYAHYSISYRDETMILLVAKGLSNKYPLKSLTDIVKYDFKLGVTRGVYYGEEYETIKSQPQINKHLYTSTGYYRNFEKLLNGQIHGILGDKFSLMYMAKEKGALNKLEIHPLHINSDKVYLMFSKKTVSTDTIDKINNSIKEVKNNGKYDNIIRRYLE